MSDFDFHVYTLVELNGTARLTAMAGFTNQHEADKFVQDKRSGYGKGAFFMVVEGEIASAVTGTHGTETVPANG